MIRSEFKRRVGNAMAEQSPGAEPGCAAALPRGAVGDRNRVLTDGIGS